MMRSTIQRAPLIRLRPTSGSRRALTAWRNTSLPPSSSIASTAPSCSSRPLLSLLPQLNKLTSRSFSSSSARRAAPFQFKLFDVGEGITEVEVLKWDVTLGQRVEEFDALCEVQSDKSSVEITAPVAGWVHSINAEPGKMVKVGQILCEIRDTEAAESSSSAPAPVESQEPPAVSEEQPSTQQPEHAPQPQQVAEMSSEHVEQVADHPSAPIPASAPSATGSTRTRRRRRHPHDDTSPPDAHDGSSPGEADHSLLSSRDTAMDAIGSFSFSGEGGVLPAGPSSVQPSADPTLSGTSQARRSRSPSDERRIVKTSPAVRNLAGRLGIDLASVRPTGEGGRVTRADVEAAAGGAMGHLSPSEAGAGPSNMAGRLERVAPGVTARASVVESTRVEFGRTRKVMWRAMGAQAAVPHFGYSHTLNLTPLLPYLKALNATPNEPKPGYLASDIPADLARSPLAGVAPKEKTTLLSFLVKALLLALEEHPIMRAKVMEKDGDRWLDIKRDGIVGIAVSDPKFGLLTPSLPPLSPDLPLSTITSALTTLRKNASRPSPSPSVTLSSVGGLGESRGLQPVLPPGGGVAIAAVGRARWEVEWARGEGKVMDLSASEVEQGGTRAVLRAPVGWSGDHRVLEGAELIAFTESWKRYVEEPWRWLGPHGL